MSDQLGEDLVLPSIRLAQIRDCVEDYEWLKLAAAFSIHLTPSHRIV